MSETETRIRYVERETPLCDNPSIAWEIIDVVNEHNSATDSSERLFPWTIVKRVMDTCEDGERDDLPSNIERTVVRKVLKELVLQEVIRIHASGGLLVNKVDELPEQVRSHKQE